MHFLNFAMPKAARLIEEAGLGSVPCGNASCSGLGNGRWATVPIQWACETGSPQVPCLARTVGLALTLAYLCTRRIIYLMPPGLPGRAADINS